MRAEDFNLEVLMDHMEFNRLDFGFALAQRYGMTEEDLTEEELEEYKREMGECAECCTPMRYGNLEWNDNLRADLCYDCDMENQEDEEQYYNEDEE